METVGKVDFGGSFLVVLQQLAQTGDSIYFYVRQPYDGGQPEMR